MAAAAPARPFEPSLSRPILAASPWIVLIVLALGEYMILLDATIINVAIPNMIKDLNTTFDRILWVLNSYILTFAILLITTGRLGGMFGPKKLFIGGLLLFTVASGACASSQTAEQLIFFRVLQAVGGAMLTPQTLSIITSIFPPDKRGAAFGIWGLVYGLGGVSGPTLGGFLTSTFSWRAIFVPNVPIGLAASALAFLVMPELTVHRRHHLDLVGVLLATVGLFALVFGIVEGQTYGWGRITSAGSFDLGPIHGSLVSIPTIFLASAVLLILFVIWEARQEEPLLPLSLFRDRNFSLGCVVSAIQTLSMIGLYLPLTLYLQRVLGLTPFEAGVAVLPQALASIVAAPVAGKLADKLNAKYLLAAGMVLYSVGVVLIVRVASVSSTGLTFTLPLIVVGLGAGFCFAPMVSMTMQNILPSASGAASGFMNTIRQVGGAFGSAIGGAIVLQQLASQLHISGGDIFSLAGRGGGPSAQAFNHDYTNAMKPALLFPVALAIVAVFLTAAMRRPRLGAAAAGAHGPMEAPPLDEAAKLAQELATPAAAEGTAQIPMPVFAAVHASDTIVLPVSIPRRVQPVRPLRAIRPPFLVQMGDPARTEHFVKNTLVLGRLPGSGLVVQDPLASRRHAEVTQVEGEWVLRDLQSANGTLLNGQPVTGDRPLHEGDTITVGNSSFVYHNDFEIARPRLLQTGGGARTIYPIRKILTIGRFPGNNVVIDDPKVSRRHAEVSTHAGVVYIRDLNSLNGTRVNGELVAGDHLLQDGDTVTVGDASFVYHNDFEAANPM
ncbi:MAG: DHA2 family efflux MFS transporter permease subunit [Chloroflexi bacterium]|nr:DHA2 family efflux MFS transporter permease subunit [Chloroflexota bacterium]